MATGTIPITGDAEADALLASDPLALLIGMLLDQQVPMEWAFRGPFTLAERLGGLDAERIATTDPDDLEQVFRAKPALHRYPGSMARRTRDLCQHLVENYSGDAAAIWRDASSGKDLFDRLVALPGYGKEKSRIFVALLAKRFGVTPEGWQEVAGPFGDSTPRSVADIDSAESLEMVREWKRARKAEGRTKADP